MAWQSDTADGSGTGIKVQRYNQNAQAIWESLGPVNNYFLLDQSNPAIASLNIPIDNNQDGFNDPNGFVVVWQSKTQDGSDWGIYARRYSENNNPLVQRHRSNPTGKKKVE